MKTISEIIRILDRRLLINEQMLLLGSVEPNPKLDNLLLELKIYSYKCRNKQIVPALLGLKKPKFPISTSLRPPKRTKKRKITRHL